MKATGIAAARWAKHSPRAGLCLQRRKKKKLLITHVKVRVEINIIKNTFVLYISEARNYIFFVIRNKLSLTYYPNIN